MDVSFLRDLKNPMTNQAGDGEHINMINYNYEYHNDAASKISSNPKRPVNTTASKKNKTSLNPTNGNTSMTKCDKFSWTKIYRSPILMPKRKSNEYITDYDNKTISNGSTSIAKPQDKGEPLLNKSTVIQVNTPTSFISVPKLKQKKLKRTKIIPKLLCPCICGGGDDEEDNMPYNKEDEPDSF